MPTDPLQPGFSIPAPVTGCLPNSAIIQAIAGQTLPGLLQKAGILDASGQFGYFQSVIQTYQNDNTFFAGAVTAIAAASNTILNTVVNAIDLTSKIAGSVSGCNTADVISATLAQSLIGVFEKYVAEIPDALKAPWLYYANWACPVQVPSHEWANGAYARTYINEEQWKCLTRINGQKEDWQAIDVQMRAEQPSALDLLLMRRKLGATSQANFIEAMEVIGWTDANGRDTWIAAQDWVPSPTDAVNWMLKDVADPQIQNTFLLGAEFSQKYSGHVKEVFDWNGIAEEDANSLWRAHWRNMAPTTLYELHKRLRPGWTELQSDDEVWHLAISICPRLPGVANMDPFANRSVSNGWPVPFYCPELFLPLDPSLVGTPYAAIPGAPGVPNPLRARTWLESLVTDGYHVSEGLGQSDYPPFWRQRLLAISYKVLTRVDVRRAYESGELNEARTLAAFQDQGYSPGDSTVLFGFYRKAAVQLHSRKPVCNQWIKTGYDVNLLKESLISQGMREDMWDEVSKILIIRRNISVQQQCLAYIEGRFLKGMIDETSAVNEILNLPIDAEQAGSIMREWKCRQKAKPKTETAAEVCNEFRSGLITGKQAQGLLRALGYTAPQARRILSLCYLQTPPKTRRFRPAPGSPADTAMQTALDDG